LILCSQFVNPHLFYLIMYVSYGKKCDFLVSSFEMDPLFS